MAEGTDVQLIQAALKSFHFRRSGIHGDAHAANKQTHALERVNQAQNVLVIGDAVIAAHLLLMMSSALITTTISAWSFSCSSI